MEDNSSGPESHVVSMPTFRLDSEFACFEDLTRTSSPSKAGIVAWAAQTDQDHLWRIIARHRHGVVQCFMVGFVLSRPEEERPTTATRPSAGFGPMAWSRYPPSLARGGGPDMDALLGSGGRSDPHVSMPTFRLDSEFACFEGLNRTSSPSKAGFVAWAAQTGQMRDHLWRIIAWHWHGVVQCFMVGFVLYRPEEARPTTAT